MKTNNIKHLNLVSFKEIMDSDVPTIVKFTNPSCHLCDGLKPIFDELQNYYSDTFNFANLNVTKYGSIAKVFKIEGVPEIFVLMKDYAKPIPYPDNPSPISGYSKEYIIMYLNIVTKELANETR